MSPRPTRTGAPSSWRLSLTTSVLLHGGVLLAWFAVAAPIGPRGGERRPEAAVVFELFRDLPDPLPEEPDEEERDLEVAFLDEPIEVRPVAYEAEPIAPDMPLERVELLPRPTDAIRPEDMTPPRPEPPPEPEVVHPDPIPEPAPPVDPPLDPPPEELEETVGEPEATETAPAPLADSCPDPPYPQRAVMRRLAGEVECMITVGADGRVVRVDVVRSSGHAILDRAARDGLLVWRFRPGTRDGVPAEMEVSKTIIFRVP